MDLVNRAHTSSGPRTPAARRAWPRAAALPAALALLLAAGLLAPPRAQATTTSYFVTLKSGVMTGEGSGDTLFRVKQAENGTLRESREVSTQGLELDFYTASTDLFGMGLALETHQYAKSFTFSDAAGALPGDRVNIEGRTLLYTLRAYLRLGLLLPFVGLGSGNYYVKYAESLNPVSFIDSAPQVWTTRYGFRMLFGRFGLLAEQGQIMAPLAVRSRADRPTLELGGRYTAFGLSYSF
ncbi:MAG: hypothetical protein HY342_01145 [Candidatus Lambdaproteobacteria bacterium]|nr:hypothetical protein [Candidatus Lambdaproteobacteria bacterium]